MQLYDFRDFKSCSRLIMQAKIMKFIFRVNFRIFHIQTKTPRIHPTYEAQLTDRLVLDWSLIGLAFGDYFEVVYDEMNQC